MSMNTSVISKELLEMADAVAREKSIDREIVVEAMEEAFRRVARARYGQEHDIRVTIHRRTGAFSIQRVREVVSDDFVPPEPLEDEPADEREFVALSVAQREKPDAEIGEKLIDELPPIEFGRNAAQMVKQVVTQRLREAERARQYEEFRDRIGEIINGTVKRVEYGNVTVDLGRAEAVLRREECIPREFFKMNDRVRALILDVRQEQRGPQIFLSRTHPTFMARLFTQEVPEIYDGIVEIKAVARDPGSRAKIGVISHDSAIDPVGACVGMRGSRVQAVVGELQGERIDIIEWSEDVARFAVSALSPAEVSKVVLDEDSRRMEVVVPDDQLSLAIGRRGQNVRLASQLVNWDIDIMTEQEESDKRQAEFRDRSELFIMALDVDEVIGHLLVAEGFSSIEEIATSEPEELENIEGFDADVASELRNRAINYIEDLHAHYNQRLDELQVSDDICGIDDFTPEHLVKLGEAGIKTLDDFADLASDELIEIVGEQAVDRARADELIMAARAHWFDDENDGSGNGDGEDAGDAAQA